MRVKPFCFGEFDPGSERTLAACLTHASRARKGEQSPEYSGARVSNAWVICPPARDNTSKEVLIPDDIGLAHAGPIEGGLCLQAVTGG